MRDICCHYGRCTNIRRKRTGPPAGKSCLSINPDSGWTWAPRTTPLSFSFRPPRRSPPVINTPQAGELEKTVHKCGNVDDRRGKKDILLLCEAGFLCCWKPASCSQSYVVELKRSTPSPEVVTHPCLVSCRFHRFCLLSRGNRPIISLLCWWKTRALSLWSFFFFIWTPFKLKEVIHSNPQAPKAIFSSFLVLSGRGQWMNVSAFDLPQNVAEPMKARRCSSTNCLG